MTREANRMAKRMLSIFLSAAMPMVMFSGCASWTGGQSHEAARVAPGTPADAAKPMMFPDLITPKSFPEALQRPDYDPLNLMPKEMPSRPRVFTTAAQLKRAAARVAAGSPIDVACLAVVISRCNLNDPIPDPASGNAASDYGPSAMRNAVAFALTGKPEHRERSLALMRLIARASPKIAWTGYEGELIASLSQTYDMLAAEPLSQEDDKLFREMLESFPAILDRLGHRRCNNHNAYAIWARLAVGLALGERQTIHDALYGCERGGNWRYGLVHLLRHDFLADGVQWEGSMSYHIWVLGAICETLTTLENCGIDLWRRELPSLVQDDGYDEHRGWGPKGNKCIRAAFDACFYQAFPNGDYSGLHDQILTNIQYTGVWRPVFNKAYEVYGDPRYSWLVNRIDRVYSRDPAAGASALPAWFRSWRGELEWIRLECRDYPAGRFSFADDATFSLTGKHVNGCSVFPAYGSSILRADPTSEDSPAASLYFGPHNAGHRSPAALHMELHVGGRRITDAPQHFMRGYDDPRHLTWNRSTIAHNTVTVDMRPMFPYDFATESLWESDRWRDSISDGELVSFQPGTGAGPGTAKPQGAGEGELAFKAVRASNDNVYHGVKLDRTVVLTHSLLIDVFRVTSKSSHQYDWAIHSHGEVVRPAGATDVTLGQERGYRHLSHAWQHPATKGWVDVPLKINESPVRMQVLLPDHGASLVIANDPREEGPAPVNAVVGPESRMAILIRSHAATTLFIAVWSFNGPVEASLESGGADRDVVIITRDNGRATRWLLPLAGPVQARAR